MRESWPRYLRTPTMKNTPAKTADGIVCKTIRSGPVMVPMIAKAMRKCDIRCSTTAVALTTGRRISDPSPSSVEMIWTSVSYTVSESVCTGAWSVCQFVYISWKLVAVDVFDVLVELNHWASGYR